MNNKTILLSTILIVPFTLNAAGSGSVNFSGKISSSTCNATINYGGTNSGSSNATITLPVVQASSLSSPGSNTGETTFTLSISGCAAQGTVRAYFEQGAAVDSGSGRLNNTATTSAASDVQLELLDGLQNYTPIYIGNINQNNAGFANIAGASITLPYAVRYYSTGTAGAGTVTSSVTYPIIYK